MIEVVPEWLNQLLDHFRMAIKEKNRTTATSRSQFARHADARCKQMGQKLAALTTRMRTLFAEENLEMTEQLKILKHQAESQFEAVERVLEQLKTANDETWQAHKKDFEDGWENLSRSMKNIIARFS